ncbi:hypothetical protein [Paenibacillus sp. Cedars]|uniref:hypothetical protein n=1 Tax=Paenibacillus sp. Cedars TaxID=1980674 RepID=UPI0020A2BC58|nr:hypothetical protein [Paenibacillus sp. Cedars]
MSIQRVRAGAYVELIALAKARVVPVMGRVLVRTKQNGVRPILRWIWLTDRND